MMKTLIEKYSLNRIFLIILLISLCFSMIFLYGCDKDGEQDLNSQSLLYQFSPSEIKSAENFSCNVIDSKNRAEFVVEGEDAVVLYSLIYDKREDRRRVDLTTSYIGDVIYLEFYEGNSSDICYFGSFSISEYDLVLYSSGTISSEDNWYSFPRGAYSEICDFIDGKK